MMARYIIYFHPGDTVPDRMKYIDDGIVAPDAGDDGATLGVTVGSLWIDGVAHRVYICEDATTGAAVWTELTGGGGTGSSSSSLEVDLSVSGATDVDGATAATHDLTLTGDATLTPTHSDPTSGEAIDLRLLIRQDGTGGRTLAWGGSISWVGGSAPTMPTDADAMMTVGLLSIDDGTTWLGYFDQTGSGGGALSDLTDVTITAAADGDFLRHNGTAWVDAPLTAADVQAPGHYELLMMGSSPPEPLEDGTGTDWLYVWVNG